MGQGERGMMKLVSAIPGMLRSAAAFAGRSCRTASGLEANLETMGVSAVMGRISAVSRVKAPQRVRSKVLSRHWDLCASHRLGSIFPWGTRLRRILYLLGLVRRPCFARMLRGIKRVSLR